MSILTESNSLYLSNESHQVIVINSPKYGVHHVLLDTEDYLALRNLRWRYSRGYAIAHNLKSKTNNNLHMHRCVMSLMLGRELLKGEVVDHINHNKLDNRRSNLRLTDNRGNSQNRKSLPGSSSQYVGVYWCKRINKWVANLTINQKKIHGGEFKTEYCASLAYDLLARQTGEVKCFNHPDINLTLEQIKDLDDPQARKPSSQYVGVHWDKKANKWVAKLTLNGKTIFGGSFKTEHSASLARDYLVRQSGEVKTLNHPDVNLSIDQIRALDNTLAE